MKKSDNLPLVSIIIPTKNAAKTINPCLKSIKSQTYKNIELIVVDNYSQDTTLEQAKSFTKSVFLYGPERSAQRNFGVRKSHGGYIAWLDVDMQLDPKVIEECVQTITKDSNIQALIIPEISIGTGFWANCRMLEKQCYLGDKRIEGVRFVSKKIFNKVGKFNKNLISGEDWDITNRIRQNGYATGRINSFVYHNEGHLRLLDDLRKKYYYSSKSLPYVEKNIKSINDILLFVFRPAFFRNWKMLADHPFQASGLFFMKFCEFGVGLIGIAAAKLKQT